MKISQRFEAWVNQPVVMPAWFGYLMMAVLASFFTTFIQINVYKSVGLVQQLIEIRGLVHGIEESINPLNVRMSELEKKLQPEQHKHWWKK